MGGGRVIDRLNRSLLGSNRARPNSVLCNTRTHARSKQPPPGYRCICGTSQAGRASTYKWRRGRFGEFLCHRCSGLAQLVRLERDRETCICMRAALFVNFFSWWHCWLQRSRMTHTHTHTLTLAHTHSHTLTHTLAHTHSLSHTHSLTPSFPRGAGQHVPGVSDRLGGRGEPVDLLRCLQPVGPLALRLHHRPHPLR